ncbi:C-type lectin domain family 7 member A-like [Drosophila bipectinata]|uniref:C-type lectin domain family 7 member A-like n=1 Tax=Drosophila bipectinata TaxID=42026 RepID=UPI0038B34B0C
MKIIAIITGALIFSTFIGIYIWMQLSPEHHPRSSSTPTTSPRTSPSTTPSIRSSTTHRTRTRITPRISPRSFSGPITSTKNSTSHAYGCGENFKAIGSKCYYIENECIQSWLGALYQCSGMGGRLASIQSQKELDYISKELKPNSEYFVDINDLSFPNVVLSASTSLASKLRHPDLKDTQDEVCVVINSLGDVAHELCDVGKLFVCEKREETTQELKQMIEQNFKKFGDKYYYIENKEKSSWMNAFQKCLEMGGHLATLSAGIFSISKELHIGARYHIDYYSHPNFSYTTCELSFHSAVITADTTKQCSNIDLVGKDEITYFICDAPIP